MKQFYTLLVVALLAVPAFANTLALDFSGASQGQSTTIGMAGCDWPFAGVNTSPEVRLSGAGNATVSTAALFYVPTLPADFAGAIINSATFTIKALGYDQSSTPITGVSVRRINTAADWQPASGSCAWNQRYTANPGATYWWANNALTGTKYDWAGNPFTWNDSACAKFETALGDVIDTKDLDGTMAGVTFDVKTLAQNWASGAWANKGFCLNTTDPTANILDMTTSGLGLVIDYTPAPEPMTMSLLVVGGLALLRRKA